MMPHENAPDVEMVTIDVCRNELSACPNALIAVGDWKAAVEEYLREKKVSERLRMRVKGGKILHHHKLRISISGCPNGCSRPQIADIGLVGFVRPAVAGEDCTACGACAAACPDKAISVDGGPPEFDRALCQGCLRCRNACPSGCITLSPPGARILLGGKLGRHPRFATVAGEEMAFSSVLELIDRVITGYIEHAEPDERFADFLLRTCNT